MHASSVSRLALPLLLAATPLSSLAAPLAPPPEGFQFAYLSTGGPGSGKGIGSTGVDLSGNGLNEADPASFTMTFHALAGQPISFALNLLTSEISGGEPDFFQVLLNDEVFMERAIGWPNAALPVIPDTAFDSLDDLVDLVGPDGSIFTDGQTGWSDFSIFTKVTGPQTLVFRILDETDDAVDSALLIDAILVGDLLLEGFEGFSPGEAPIPSPDPSRHYAIAGNVTVAEAAGFVPVPVPVPALGAGWLLAAALGLRLRRRAVA